MENNNILVGIAERNMIQAIIQLSADTLKPDNDAIYNEEFLCPQGLRASVTKGFVITAFSGKCLCGMLRFYPNKRMEQISVYQFAVSESERGRGIVPLMLSFLREHYNGAIICKCPTDSSFNDYYRKTGWTKVAEREYSYWEWGVKLL